MIEISNFIKHYGDFQAVRGATFHVPAGSVAALVGPNGAGKTTTIRTMSGILRPTGGTLRIAGFDLQREPLEVKRRVAYVPDDPPLFESLTVFEHLQFVASSYQLIDWKDEAEHWLSLFELQEKRQTLASELSRGMRQKVAIACAYLRRPDVLLLDEPMTGLDPPSIRRLKETIGQQSQRGATVLVSSHLLSLVEDLCDELVLIRRGQVLYCGGLEKARVEYGGPRQSLEEVFFHLTGLPESEEATSTERELE
ncbi:ABC transporter ATP-binding protein [Roseiconus lacunae]|uniref:ABC transporter ATP-binding protein n=1 Tax=Roseiconus lacunae TaxID=2605694 RepID=A0ABT7PCR2_9BACT|nr:ABC transporter ATP-binding protein [Roseiconus lacunae]MCD0459594.1 ABC transporter ATP-binding protein [Roseiconus lacunae]MDM4014292.1 ABC transporter ATP-binding protein [Roseiconus lacunae]WRQ49610.1 ABC transporter ATP-binding protein [Stieleria sp. HD01]